MAAKPPVLDKRWQSSGELRTRRPSLARAGSMKALKVLGLAEAPEDRYYNTWEQDMQDAHSAVNEPVSGPEVSVREQGDQRSYHLAYVAFVVATYLVIVLGVQFLAVWMWPRAEMYLPASKLEPTSKIHERIAERNVPPLQSSRPNFAHLGSEVIQRTRTQAPPMPAATASLRGGTICSPA